MTLSVTRDITTWNKWCEKLGVDDPYYKLTYCRLWKTGDATQVIGLKFTTDTGTVLYPFLKEPLDYVTGGNQFYDIRTPYDFGGPIVISTAPKQTRNSFEERWYKFVDQASIVTEFNRLHPYLHASKPTDASFHADNIHVDLSQDYEKIFRAYHQSHRNHLRNAKSEGLKSRFVEKPTDDIKKRFQDLYYRTMLKVDADSEYFFARSTLDSLLEHPSSLTLSISYNDNMIASGIFIGGGAQLFYLLGCSSRQHLEKRPNNLLLDLAVRFALSRGYSYLHLGGGSEGVRHFKKQIGNGSVSYYIIKRVHNQSVYEQLCKEASPNESGTFPEYRSLKFKDKDIPPTG